MTHAPDTWYGSSSDVGYSDGVSMSFKISALTNNIVAGLTTNPTGAIGGSPGGVNLGSIDYRFIFDSSAGVSINTSAVIYTYTTADVFTIQYDGSYVRFFINDVLAYSIGPVTPGPRLYLAVCIYNNSTTGPNIDGITVTTISPTTVNNIRFTPMGMSEI